MDSTWRAADDTSAAISPEVTFITYTNERLRANIRVADWAVMVLAKGQRHDPRTCSPFTVAFFAQTSDS